MRQRNDSGQPLTVHTDPPQLLEPGAVIDHDTYVVGLTVVDDEVDSAPKPTADAAAAQAKKSKEATR